MNSIHLIIAVAGISSTLWGDYENRILYNGRFQALEHIDLYGSMTLNGAMNAIDTQNYNVHIMGTIVDGDIPGGFAKQGSGTLTLVSPNHFSGGMTILDGVVRVSDDIQLGSSTGTLAFNGGALQLSSDLSSNRATTFSSDAVVVVDGSVTASMAGPMTGFGGLVKIGDGVLALSGENEYLGQTHVTNGTLRIENSHSLRGNAIINSNLEFAQRESTEYSGILSGNGNLHLATGSSISFADSLRDFLGETTVHSGTLHVNGQTGGLVHVAGGVLKGNGSIGNSLKLSSGILSPGNSIGTMTVLGDYAQTGGIYAVQVDGNGASTLLNVGGSATIGGGSAISVVSTSGYYLINTPHHILSADGGVTAKFANASVANYVLTPTFISSINDLYLVLETSFIQAASTSNQINVATQLDKITDATPAQLALIEPLLPSLSLPQIQNIYTQLSGTQYADEFAVTELSTKLFAERIYMQLRPLVTNRICYDRCGLPIWIQASGGQSSFKGDSNAPGFTANDFEVTLGVEKAFDSSITVGAAVSYENETRNFYLKGKDQRDYALLALYGLYRPSAYYVLADLIFGYQTGRLERSVDEGTVQFKANSKPHSFQTALYTEAGFDLCVQNVIIQPFVSVLGGFYDYFSTSEKGESAINLNVRDKMYGVADGRLGVHITQIHQPSGTELGIDLAWQCRLTQLEANRQVAFQTFGDFFQVTGFTPARNSVDGALTLSKLFNDCFRAYVQAAGSASHHFSNYSVLGGVSTSF